MATKLAEAVQATVAAYAAQIPLPTCPDCENAEARESVIRQWTYGLAEQVAFSHPGEGWGTKRASRGRPISKDTITQKTGDKMTSYDIVVGAGGATPELHINASAIDTTGQVFEPVTPVDHINSASGGGTVEPGGETGSGTETGGVSTDVLASRLAAAEASVLALQQHVTALQSTITQLQVDLALQLAQCVKVTQVRSARISTDRRFGHAHETALQVIDLPETKG